MLLFKRIPLFLLSVILIYSCSDANPVEGDKNGTNSDRFSVSYNRIISGPEGQSNKIIITIPKNQKWTITGAPEWCDFNIMESIWDEQVVLTILPNNSLYTRMAEIGFKIEYDIDKDTSGNILQTTTILSIIQEGNILNVNCREAGSLQIALGNILEDNRPGTGYTHYFQRMAISGEVNYSDIRKLRELLLSYLDLSKVVIKESVIKDNGRNTVSPGNAIDEGLFSYFYNIQKIILPNSVIEFRERAFYNCSQLEEINIPDHIKILPKECFANCTSLETIEFPSELQIVEDAVFSECSSLKHMNFRDKLTSIGAEAFKFCKSLESITLSSGISYIGHSAFSGCENLVSITLPNNITSIFKDTFSGCSSLQSVVFPNELREIHPNAFGYCKNLNTIILPENLKTIGTKVFYRTPLNSVTLNSKIIPTVNTTVANGSFDDKYIKDCKLYVPESLIDDYKKDEFWNLFASIEIIK